MQIFPNFSPDAKLWQNFLTRSDKNYIFHLEDIFSPHDTKQLSRACVHPRVPYDYMYVLSQYKYSKTSTLHFVWGPPKMP